MNNESRAAEHKAYTVANKSKARDQIAEDTKRFLESGNSIEFVPVLTRDEIFSRFAINPKIAARMKREEGRSLSEIARELGVTRTTIRNWVKPFN
jgi:DNA-directed RNA polymerase specialized sigma24 family protein